MRHSRACGKVIYRRSLSTITQWWTKHGDGIQTSQRTSCAHQSFTFNRGGWAGVTSTLHTKQTYCVCVTIIINNLAGKFLRCWAIFTRFLRRAILFRLATVTCVTLRTNRKGVMQETERTLDDDFIIINSQSYKERTTYENRSRAYQTQPLS